MFRFIGVVMALISCTLVTEVIAQGTLVTIDGPVIIDDTDPVDIEGSVSVTGNVGVLGVVTTHPALPAQQLPIEITARNDISSDSVFASLPANFFLTQIVVAGGTQTAPICAMDFQADNGSPVGRIARILVRDDDPSDASSTSMIILPLGNGIRIENDQDIAISTSTVPSTTAGDCIFSVFFYGDVRNSK